MSCRIGSWRIFVVFFLLWMNLNLPFLCCGVLFFMVNHTSVCEIVQVFGDLSCRRYSFGNTACVRILSLVMRFSWNLEEREMDVWADIDLYGRREEEAVA